MGYKASVLESSSSIQFSGALEKSKMLVFECHESDLSRRFVLGLVQQDGFRPRHFGPSASPIVNDNASSSLSSMSRWLRSAFASSVS